MCGLASRCHAISQIAACALRTPKTAGVQDSVLSTPHSAIRFTASFAAQQRDTGVPFASALSELTCREHGIVEDTVATMTLLSDVGVIAAEDGPSEAAVIAESGERQDTVTSSSAEKAKSIGRINAVHDLIAGGAAGSASVIVGHPFDTIKVRMQVAQPSATSAGGMSGAATSFGGFSSLFRGIGAPLSTAAVVNAIIFASYGATSRLWDAIYHIPHNEDEEIHGVVAG